MLRSLTGKKLAFCINVVCCLSIFFFGYDQGMMGGVNGSVDYVRTMKLGKGIPPTEDYPHWDVDIDNPTKEGGIVAIYYLGTLIGAILGGFLGDWLGRINTVRIGCAWVILGAALQSSAQNAAWMLVARVINGVGTGHLNVIVPVWSAETSDYTVRGVAIAIEFTANIFGVVVAYWLNYGLSFINQGDTEFRWRFPIAFQLVPLLLLAIFINFMPESPRWLVQKNRDSEALEILGRLRGEGNPEDARAVAEYKDIKETISDDADINTNFLGMAFRSQGKMHISRRVQLVVWFQIFQEWVGIASITVYQPTIFKQAGFDSNKSGWLSGLNNVFYCISTLVAIFTIDRYGRRFNSFWGAAAQGISLFLVGGFSRAAQNQNSAALGAASASFVFIFTFIFGATWLTIPWVYQNEIWPVQIRSKGAAWGVIGWSIGNGWLMLLNPVMFDNIEEKTFYIFGAVNFLAIIVVYLFYPETAQRTLEEIDWLFSSDSPFNWAAEKAYAEKAAQHVNFTKAMHNNQGEKLDLMGVHEHAEQAESSPEKESSSA